MSGRSTEFYIREQRGRRKMKRHTGKQSLIKGGPCPVSTEHPMDSTEQTSFCMLPSLLVPGWPGYLIRWF